MATKRKQMAKPRQKGKPRFTKVTTSKKSRKVQKNQENQKKGSEDGAAPASIAKESQADREGCARLSQPCLPGSCPGVSATLTTIVKQRNYLPEIVKRYPWVFGAVKELLAGLPGDAKHNLILPRQVICTFGFCVSLPTFFLGEEDADGHHADAERERHYGVARLMTAKPLLHRSFS